MKLEITLVILITILFAIVVERERTLAGTSCQRSDDKINCLLRRTYHD